MIIGFILGVCASIYIAYVIHKNGWCSTVIEYASFVYDKLRAFLPFLPSLKSTDVSKKD